MAVRLPEKRVAFLTRSDALEISQKIYEAEHSDGRPGFSQTELKSAASLMKSSVPFSLSAKNFQDFRRVLNEALYAHPEGRYEDCNGPFDAPVRGALYCLQPLQEIPFIKVTADFSRAGEIVFSYAALGISE